MSVSEQELATIDTYDRNAASWANAHNFDLSENVFADPLFEFYKYVQDGSSVLEIGCGGGRDAAELIQHYKYLGTDASIGMVEAARKNVPTGTFQQCSVYDLGRLKQRFDAFWTAAVLLHIPKSRIDEALTAINSVMVPKAIGMIAIKDGDREEFEVRDNDGLHEERLFTYWTRQDFEAALARNAMSVVYYAYKPVSQRTNWHFFITKNDR